MFHVCRLNSFSISEEYASVHCRNYASHRILESYAERIYFFFEYFFTTCPIPPLPCHTDRKPPSNFIAGRPKAALLFWFFIVALLSICLWYVSIVATCIAVHFAVCHALYNNKNKKIGKNRCLVFLNDLVLFCSVILSL